MVSSIGADSDIHSATTLRPSILIINPFFLSRHPFSITSAPGDDYLSVHIRIVGDWTQELKRIFTEGTHLPPSIIGPAKLSTLLRQKDQTRWVLHSNFTLLDWNGNTEYM